MNLTLRAVLALLCSLGALPAILGGLLALNSEPIWLRIVGAVAAVGSVVLLWLAFSIWVLRPFTG